VAHEFKNPILCICELVDRLAEENCLDSTEILKQIKSMSNYLIILVKDLDYFSQKSTGVVKTVELDYINLNELLKFCQDIVIALIKRVNKVANLKFEIIKGGRLPKQIYSDEIKLKQILINLLSNSIKYTQTGSIVLDISLHNNNIKFKIHDTGRGISDDQKAKLFIPFSNEYDKLNKVSSGLGLSIVKEITELLGSKIDFESQVGKGSTFAFEIPLTSKENELNVSYISELTVEGVIYCDKNLNTYYNPVDNSGIKYLSVPKTEEVRKDILILVVDDEILGRQSTVRLLFKYLNEKQYNPTIVEASDGIECLYQCLLLCREGKRIDFILSDESMEFMSGSVCAEILQNLYQVKCLNPVPFYTLTAFETLGVHNGVSDVFTKPLRKHNIELVLKRLQY
jgi:CheY-like chemotaxis protein